MSIVLICEYLEGGTLYNYLKKNEKLDEAIACEIVLQIAYGLNAIHKKGFVHRDLKLENVMISSFDPIQIKLIDFGFSEKINRTRLTSG